MTKRFESHDTLLSRVLDVSTPRGLCWEVSGSGHEAGYVRVSHLMKSYYAHRVVAAASVGRQVWELTREDVVRHSCDNPRCVNPAHLTIGTHQENMTDKEVKGRGAQPKGEGSPHSKLTDEAVRAIRASSTPHTEEALKWGVHASTISTVRSGKAWSHVI